MPDHADRSTTGIYCDTPEFPGGVITLEGIIHLVAFLTREQRYELEVADGWTGPFSRHNLAELDSDADNIQPLAGEGTIVLGEKPVPTRVSESISPELDESPATIFTTNPSRCCIRCTQNVNFL